MRTNLNKSFGTFTRKADLPITRSVGEIARGISIVLIMLHNLLHVFPAIVTENEFEFHPDRNHLFTQRLQDDAPTIIYDIISFVGWYGVPVFIFLSGYGLVKRYDNIRDSFSTPSFLRRSWLKLFLLMLPGVVCFLGEEIWHKLAMGDGIDWKMVLSMSIPLTCLNDFVEIWVPTVPGVYWYLGLAFELYLIYALFVHGRSLRPILLLTALCFLLTLYFTYSSLQTHNDTIIVYLRHNFTGWMLPFAFGVWYGRTTFNRIIFYIALLAASIFLFLPLLQHPAGWQIAGLAAVIVIMATSFIFSKIRYCNSIWAWIGRISPFLYVSHPLVRHLLGRYLLDFNSREALPTPKTLLIYLSCTLAAALLYRLIWNALTSLPLHRLPRLIRI